MSARSDWGTTSKELVRLIVRPHSTSAVRSGLFDVVRVVHKESDEDDFRDSVLGQFDLPLFQLDFGCLDLGEVSRD